MIAVIDYGVNNISSICKGLRLIDVKHEVIKKDITKSKYTHIVLPGVGSFDSGVSNLRKYNIDAQILNAVKSGAYLLGICLGMQLLFDNSEESILNTNGLGLINGFVKKLNCNNGTITVPHVGWNIIKLINNSKVTFTLNRTDQYFIHSLFTVPDDPTVVKAECLHGIFFPAIVEKDNVIGVQFHPEKTKSGLDFLKRFSEL